MKPSSGGGDYTIQALLGGNGYIINPESVNWYFDISAVITITYSEGYDLCVDIDYADGEMSVDTTEEYYDAYKVMHDSFMSELPLDFGSIAVVRSHFKATSMHFTLAREAQYKLCNDLDNLCMASRVFETCTKNDMHNTSAGGSGIHALQKTYNRVGTDSANNVLEFIGELEAPKFTTVSVFNQDGKVEAKFNQEGSVIAGDDIFTAAQTVIPFVDSITNKNKVEFVAQDGIVDEYGNILATAFDTYDSVKLECEFDENVEMDSEIVTSTTTTVPVNYDYSLSPEDAKFTISNSTFTKYASYSANGGKYFYERKPQSLSERIL